MPIDGLEHTFMSGGRCKPRPVVHLEHIGWQDPTNGVGATMHIDEVGYRTGTTDPDHRMTFGVVPLPTRYPVVVSFVQ